MAVEATGGIQVRLARPEDADIIARFNGRLAEETEHRTLDAGVLGAGVRAVLGDSTKGLYYVAEVGGEIVGQLMITYEWSDWRNGNFWWVQSVYVKQECRSRGVFAALFEHVRRLAREGKEVCGIRLYVEESNERAKRTYEKLGLKKTGYELFEIDLTL
jgi:ribosomal protein S18 acetylase RimI-like enzyme